MKIFFKIILTYFFSLIFSLNAEIVNELVISGNKRVSEETIKVYGGIEIGKDYNERDLDNIIRDLYGTEFFENVEVNLQNGKLNINLKEYSIINQLILVGEDSKRFRDQIKKIINKKEKKSFIKSNISSDIDIIKNFYAANGYNNSEIEISTKKIDQNKLDLIIDINKGKETLITSINFIGNKKVKEKRLRDIIASEEHKFWKVLSRNSKFNSNLIQLDKRLLLNYYRSLGYYNAKITSSYANLNERSDIDLTYSIEAGKRYTVTKIKTETDPVFDKNLFAPLRKVYEKYVGEYYSPFDIKDILDEIDDVIEKNNLQFVEHSVEEDLDDLKGEVSITFKIYESDKILVERINVLGNNVTNESVIRGELLLDEGDPFTKLALDKSVSKLKSRNIFLDVKSKVQDGSKNNLKTIEIIVEEKPTGEISAGAGIGTNGGTFAINISENNWLGEGKKVGFEIEVDEESLAGTINYSNPNYDFYGNDLNYFLSSSTNDKPTQGYENKIMTAGINTTFEYFKDLYANLGISGTYDDLRVLSNASDTLKKQKGEFSEIAGTYGFKYDKRNRTFMPTKGSVVSFNQSLPIYADKRFITNSLALSNYKSFSENVVGASKIFLTSVNGIGDDVRLSKRRKLSSSRLRGFERGKIGPVDGTDHIGGNYAAALNLEASLPNLLPENSKTDVGLFLDFGNVWGVDYSDSIDSSNEIRSSGGAAASWLSPIGPMTFILSTNLSKADTDETQSFSFNLGTTF